MVRIDGPASGSPPRWVWVAIVLAFTFVTFSGTLDFEFVHDDRGQIVGNPAVQSWGHVREYFTAHVWAHIDPYEMGNYYRPIFLLWLRINHMLFGLNPWRWHLTTVLAHLVVTLLVYFVASAVLRDPWAAVFSALIFGLHPAHVEAVAWIAGVTEPLLGILFLGSFLCHLRAHGQTERGRTWRGLSLGLFAVALLAKETAIVLPIVVMAYEWICGETGQESSGWKERLRRLRRAFRMAAPFLILVPIYLLVRIMALKGFSPAATPYTFSTMCLTWPSLIWFWIEHLFWPTGLSSSYNFPAVTDPGWGNFVLPLCGVALTGAVLYWACRRSRAVQFAAAWMVLLLLPPMNLRAFVESDFAHDRYLYLPSVGFAMIVALGLRKIPSPRAACFGLPATQAAIVVVLALAMMADTVYQSFYFGSDAVFYPHNARTAPDNWVAKNNLGMWLRDRGDYDAAIHVFKELTEKYPRSWASAHNLAFTYYKQGRLEEADLAFRKAILVNPSQAESYMSLGLTRFRMNRLDEAEQLMGRAIQLRPGGHGYHFALGVVLRTRGDLSGAREEFKIELTNFPEQVAVRQQLAEVEAELGRMKGSGGGQSPYTAEHERRRGSPRNKVGP